MYMRIMLDTNILVSVIIFKSNKLKEMLVNICNEHSLVLSSCIIEELEYVVDKKFPNKIEDLSEFLYQLPFETVFIPKELLINNKIKIRDLKDLPILNSAVISDVDIFITGDKDFEEIKLNKPQIMSANKFMEKYY